MKHFNTPGTNIKLTPQNYENIFNVYVDKDTEMYYFNLLRTVNFPEDLDPRVYYTYVVGPTDTWPTISWKHYKNVKLWWIICSANQIQNPTDHPKSGTVLKIITPQYIRSIIHNLKGD